LTLNSESLPFKTPIPNLQSLHTGAGHCREPWARCHTPNCTRSDGHCQRGTHPKLESQNSKPHPRVPQPSTFNPKPKTFNPELWILIPEPRTLNHEPKTLGT